MICDPRFRAEIYPDLGPRGWRWRIVRTRTPYVLSVVEIGRSRWWWIAGLQMLVAFRRLSVNPSPAQDQHEGSRKA